MSDIQPDSVSALMDAGRAQAARIEREDGGAPFVIIPNHYKVHDLTLQVPPRRIIAAVNLVEINSFCEYVKRYATANTLIFANDMAVVGRAQFVAVLDYHGAAPDLKADYVNHRAVLSLNYTEEMNEWMSHDREEMSQRDFALWLEDNYTLIVDPAGATLLELVQNLIAKSGTNISSAIRLESGAHKLKFEHDVDVRAGGDSSLELPRTIKAGIAPFLGMAKYEIPARLKYRVENRTLGLSYETVGLKKILRDAIQGVAAQIEGETKIKPLFGSV